MSSPADSQAQDIVARFEGVCQNRHAYAAQWKKRTGGRVLGLFCEDVTVPEEIIHAAGCLPVRIFGHFRTTTPQADAHLQSNICQFARTALDLGLDGTYSYLDGIVGPHRCDTLYKVYDVWRLAARPGFSHLIDIPHRSSPEARAYCLGELNRFQASLEGFVGAAITAEALAVSIQTYNENRALLRRLYQLRLRQPPPISGSQVLAVVMASVLMPKEEHNLWLQELLAALEELPAAGPAAPRLFVSGTCFDDVRLMRLIEDAGATVVADDFCTGSRYFWDDVDTRLPPLEALAQRYLDKVPGASIEPIRLRFAHIERMVRDYAADGAVLYLLKYCDAHCWDYPALRKLVEGMGLPVLHLEGDHSASGRGQFKTRIEAFVEMLGG